MNERAASSCLFSLLSKSGSLAFLETHNAALTYRDAKQHEQLGSLAADRDNAGNSSADADIAAPAQTREQPNGAAAPDSHDGSRGISSQQVQSAAACTVDDSLPPEAGSTLSFKLVSNTCHDTRPRACFFLQQPSSAARQAAAAEQQARRAALEEQALPLMLDAMVRPVPISHLQYDMQHQGRLVSRMLCIPQAQLFWGLRKMRSLWVSVQLQWAANVLDIESTLARVCQRVLGETAASREVRHARALALRELGRIFRATKVCPALWLLEQRVLLQMQAIIR